MHLPTGPAEKTGAVMALGMPHSEARVETQVIHVTPMRTPCSSSVQKDASGSCQRVRSHAQSRRRKGCSGAIATRCSCESLLGTNRPHLMHTMVVRHKEPSLSQPAPNWHGCDVWRLGVQATFLDRATSWISIGFR